MRYLVLLLLACLAGPLSAQVAITETPLTPEAAAGIVAFYNAEQTTRLSGDSRVAAGNELSGNVAVLEGSLTLAGHISGDLVVINGDAVFEQGAHVDGTVSVVGGSIRGADLLSAQRIVWYRGRLKYELRDGLLFLARESQGGELSAGRQFKFGRTDMLVAARGGYNRSEGLPIFIGPRLTLSGSNPTMIEGLFIFRSAALFRFDEQDYGYALRAEQFVGGRRARVGVRYASEVQPVELWGLSDRETSLAGFVLHQDFRDHYTREGWSAYIGDGRSGNPFDWRIEYAAYRYFNAPLRDPYSLFNNPDAWRDEPQVDPVRLRTLHAQTTYDTRNDDRDASSGWLVNADVEAAVALRSGAASSFSPHYRFALIDVRRYARLSPLSRVQLRAVAAGSISGAALPVFRQQSLGGEGSLPGYKPYAYDCGGHDSTGGPGRTLYYGCDRLVLFQLEYQARFRWLSRLSSDLGPEYGLFQNIRGVLFFDTGRTWNEPEHTGARALGSSDFVADAGFGLRFGRIGAYWALPLSARVHGLNFFVRLEPRL
ncbi:MAG TPA: BamA/TamA family outer membrane protein [Longimicrobiales bacterium]